MLVGTVRGSSAWGEWLTWGLEIESTPPMEAPCQWRTQSQTSPEVRVRVVSGHWVRAGHVFPGWGGAEEDSGLRMLPDPGTCRVCSDGWYSELRSSPFSPWPPGSLLSLLLLLLFAAPTGSGGPAWPES